MQQPFLSHITKQKKKIPEISYVTSPTLPLILDLTVSVGRWDSGLGWEEGGTACNRSACIASDAHWPLSSMYVNLSWPDTDTDPFQMAPPGLSLGGSGQYQCCGSLVTKALRDPVTEIL